MPRLRALFLRAPLALSLLAVIGVLCGGWAYSLCLLACGIALWQRFWRQLLAIILFSLLAFMQLGRIERDMKEVAQELAAESTLHLRGTIVRETEYTRFLELDNSPVRVELRGKVAGALGQRVEVTGMAYQPRQAAHRLPGSFDREGWLRRQAVAYSMEVHETQILDTPWSWSRCLALSQQWRERLLHRLMPEGTEDDARRQVLCALVLGEKSRADEETLELFAWSGGLHAFAVSGLHVGIVATLIWLFCRLCRLSPRSSIILTLLLVAAYVFLTGMAVSSLRAYLMMGLALLGFLLRRQVILLNIWCAAALLILLISPLQLGQAGFLLSFLVYAAIIIALSRARKESPWFGADPYLPRALYSKWDWRRHALERALRFAIVVSLSAWLVSLPLMMIFFHSFNSWGFVTNLLISPLLPLVMGAGLLCILFGSVPILGAVLQYAALQLSGVLLSVVTWCAGLPAAYLPTTPSAPDDSYMVMNLGYKKSATVLGNASLLISGGNEADTRWRLRPALFASGYRPLLYLPEARPSTSENAAVLNALWQDMDSLDSRELAEEKSVYQSGDSTWTIYASPLRAASRPTAAELTPIVLWEHKGKRLLYLGDTASSTLHYWQSRGESLHASTIILGHNPKHPDITEQELQQLGCKHLILLPTVPAQRLFSLPHKRVENQEAYRVDKF